jgi:predicted RNase H-like HicB family nuclease
MRNYVFPAKVTPDPIDGGYVVQFVDLPEAITQGETFKDAVIEAVDCLEEAIVNRIALGIAIPMVVNAETFRKRCGKFDLVWFTWPEQHS